MKKSFLLFFTLMLAFAWCNIVAQEESASNGAVPYMKVEKIHTIVTQLENPASIAYGFESQAGVTLSMPIPAGTPFTNLGTFTAPTFASSMTKGGDGVYYLTDNGPPGALYSFDPGTGAVTFIASLSGNSEGPNGIAFNPADNMYYMIGSTAFYSVDVGTGAATLIGNTGVSGALFIDLCFDAAGVCYSYDLVTDAAYTIDPTTGVATQLGPLGFDANFGQGMSYDMETSTIYLSAFNNGTFTGQLRTMDPGTGSTTLITDWGLAQVAPFALDTQYGPPCPVGQASNPTPANGATDIPLTGNTAMWTNGANATSIEVFFNGASVYSGAPITSLSLAGVEPLEYSTTYTWKVNGSDGNCTTSGSTWSFTTMADPNLTEYCEEFNDLTNWTPIGPLGLTNWSAANTSTAGGTPPELLMNWTPSFTGVSAVRSAVIPITFPGSVEVNYSFRFFLDWYADPSGVVTVGVTYDGGTTVDNLYTLTDPTANVGPLVVSGSFTAPAAGTNTMQVEISYNGYSFNIDAITWDDMCIGYIIPVELTSFTATGNFGSVDLQWITATEKNNQGFEVQRSNGEEFETIAFVEGFGTTTETQVYTYSDKSVEVGDYTYRLKQIDFDGTFTYSSEVEVDVPAPSVFALDQNYPNPFNPSTKINFQLKVDSKVSLKIFDVLGQEVATLVNTNLVAGGHSINFNASALNSGVYLYRIEATGIDGSNFIDAKKMILTK